MTPSDRVYYCKICEKTWEDKMPEGAVPLTNHKRGGNGQVTTFRFEDGSIHSIVRIKATKVAGDKHE